MILKKKFINTEHPDYTSDKITVQKNGMWLKHVERQFQTEEMCRFAVLQNGKALKYVQKKTEEMCRFAVLQNGKALKYVQKKTEEICRLAIQKDVFAIENIYLIGLSKNLMV